MDTRYYCPSCAVFPSSNEVKWDSSAGLLIHACRNEIALAEAFPSEESKTTVVRKLPGGSKQKQQRVQSKKTPSKQNRGKSGRTNGSSTDDHRTQLSSLRTESSVIHGTVFGAATSQIGNGSPQPMWTLGGYPATMYGPFGSPFQPPFPPPVPTYPDFNRFPAPWPVFGYSTPSPTDFHQACPKSSQARSKSSAAVSRYRVSESRGRTASSGFTKCSSVPKYATKCTQTTPSLHSKAPRKVSSTTTSSTSTETESTSSSTESSTSTSSLTSSEPRKGARKPATASAELTRSFRPVIVSSADFHRFIVEATGTDQLIDEMNGGESGDSAAIG